MVLYPSAQFKGVAGARRMPSPRTRAAPEAKPAERLLIAGRWERWREKLIRFGSERDFTCSFVIERLG